MEVTPGHWPWIAALPRPRRNPVRQPARASGGFAAHGPEVRAHLAEPSACWRRAMSGGAAEDEAEAKAFLLKLRYSPAVADGVIVALKSSGALLPTLYAMAGAWVRVPLPSAHCSVWRHRTRGHCSRTARSLAAAAGAVEPRCAGSCVRSSACTRGCSGMCWGLKCSRGAGSGGRRWAGGTGKGSGARARGKRRGQDCPLPSQGASSPVLGATCPSCLL